MQLACVGSQTAQPIWKVLRFADANETQNTTINTIVFGVQQNQFFNASMSYYVSRVSPCIHMSHQPTLAAKGMQHAYPPSSNYAVNRTSPIMW